MAREPPRREGPAAPLWGRPVLAFARQWPFLSFFLLVVLSNVVGSYFNIAYNQELIVEPFLTGPQRAAFWNVLYTYNALAYSIGFGLIVYFLRPLARCRSDLRGGHPVTPARLEGCRRLLINLPLYQVLLTFLAWLPGAVVFPLGICLLGGWDGARYIWIQFGVSFTISALLTTMQTFFLLEAFLIDALYGDFFANARPAEVHGSLRLTLGWRVLLLWGAVALVPLLALLAVTLNFHEERTARFDDLRRLGVGVTLVGLPFSAFLMWMMARNLLKWVRVHSRATQEIAAGNFRVRIGEQRPDEWGQLTDRFNDMATALERGEQLRETFGQFVNPDVRDEILERYPDLGGDVEEVTVVFADIRGFTRRVEGASPEHVVSLLNAFLSISVAAVEDAGGWVNKFLGDGFMALFGAPRPRQDHADLALRASRDLLSRLESLNADLARRGETPVVIGIGIHTGPALVGCIGATLAGPNGAHRARRELTAIGETVNLAQRLEGLTKVHGGPILVSDATYEKLAEKQGVVRVGSVSVPGYEGAVVVHRA
jgi:adenylate cyclase